VIGVLYLVTGTKPVEAMQLVEAGPPRSGPGLGYISQPGSNPPRPTGWWAADNGCVMAGPTGVPIPNPKWSADGWLTWLESLVPVASRCLFVVLPDVVCDHRATLARSLPWAERIRELGFPVALACQNGAEDDPVLPWDAIDCAFIAGDDAFKIGPAGHRVARAAQAAGKWVHMGRVNSLRRLRVADWFGCDSADGTFLAHGPDKNLPQLLDWLDRIVAERDQGELWTGILREDAAS